MFKDLERNTHGCGKNVSRRARIFIFFFFFYRNRPESGIQKLNFKEQIINMK